MPVIERRLRRRERNGAWLPGSNLALSRAGPVEERDDAARSAVLITIIQMVRRGVVEIHRFLDQPQTKQPGVKIDIRLRVRCDRSEMMESGNVVVHEFSFLPDLAMARLGRVTQKWALQRKRAAAALSIHPRVFMS